MRAASPWQREGRAERGRIGPERSGRVQEGAQQLSREGAESMFLPLSLSQWEKWDRYNQKVMVWRRVMLLMTCEVLQHDLCAD